MRNMQKGFTLIELVVVIVILGILAATALPKFINLSGDANAAALQGVAGALASGTTIRYAARQVNTAHGAAVTTCSESADVLQGNTLPTGYTFSAGSTTVGAGSTINCVISSPGGNTGNALVTGS